MTPAINSARHAGIAFQLHEYQHDNAAPSYGLEAAEKLGVTAEQVFKTLVVSLDGKQLAVGIVPVNSQLGLKQIAKAAGAKKAVMAAPEIVERTTGYVLGGVSPLGQKKRLPTLVRKRHGVNDRLLQIRSLSAGSAWIRVLSSPPKAPDTGVIT